MVGHFSMDCPQGASLLCFHYNQVGHKKVDRPTMRGGAVSAPALVTVRITSGNEGRVGAPSERIRALQCQTGEARTPTGDIAGMLSFAFSLVIICIHIAWCSISV